MICLEGTLIGVPVLGIKCSASWAIPLVVAALYFTVATITLTTLGKLFGYWGGYGPSETPLCCFPTNSFLPTPATYFARGQSLYVCLC